MPVLGIEFNVYCRQRKRSQKWGRFLFGKNMTKDATIWRPIGGGDVTPENEGDFLLLETGDNILLETGDDILLEPSVVTTKAATAWEET